MSVYSPGLRGSLRSGAPPPSQRRQRKRLEASIKGTERIALLPLSTPLDVGGMQGVRDSRAMEFVGIPPRRAAQPRRVSRQHQMPPTNQNKPYPAATFNAVGRRRDARRQKFSCDEKPSRFRVQLGVLVSNSNTDKTNAAKQFSDNIGVNQSTNWTVVPHTYLGEAGGG